MPDYLTPGVYVHESASASASIEGVATAVAAFLGLAPAGPFNEPVRVASWADFAKAFSDPENGITSPFMDGAYLAHAVYGFFENGGQLCWVVRLGAEAEPEPARAVIGGAAANGNQLTVTSAVEELAGPITIEVSEDDAGGGAEGRPADAKPSYTFEIKGPGDQREQLEGLKPSTLVKDVNARSKLIRLEAAGSLKAVGTGSYRLEPASTAVAPAVDGDMVIGDVAQREGIGALAPIDEVTMLCVPDAVSLDDSAFAAVQAAMISHCEGHGDRMAILDPPAAMKRPQDVQKWRAEALPESKFAALYFPWVEGRDPVAKRPVLVPPCGHIAGIWARSDGARGVHKAPANEVVRGATGLAFQVAHAEQGSLNQAGINCIRSFPGRGQLVWGARTLSTGDAEWRYLNVRRLFNYVSASIIRGTGWAVFEPNDERLWLRLQVSTASFLTRLWRDGALFGATPEQAFYVKCDEDNNPPEEIDAGRVTIEVGIAPVKPAEFVVFEICQRAADAQLAA